LSSCTGKTVKPSRILNAPLFLATLAGFCLPQPMSGWVFTFGSLLGELPLGFAFRHIAATEKSLRTPASKIVSTDSLAGVGIW